MSEGRAVQRIWWNGANGDSSLEADEHRTLVFESMYHGDHQCEYVAEIIDGKEVAQHNARYIASIFWAGDYDSTDHRRSNDS